MTSLSKFILVGNRTDSGACMTSQGQSLNLAFESLEEMPDNLVGDFGSTVRILDISYNKFSCLGFLAQFENLSHLILDHNEVDSDILFPHIPTLHLLWLNHNKINDLFPFIRNLHKSVPNVRYLSLMGNAAAPSYLNGGTFYEYLQYRLFVISWFPNLIHLDDRSVTEDQRQEAHRLFKRPLFERLPFSSTHSSYLRIIHDKFLNFFVSMERYFPGSQSNRSAVI